MKKTLLFFLSLAFTLPVFSQQFSLPITVTDGNGELILTVGLHPDGSFDFVPGLDQVLPPPPPTGTFDTRIRVNNADYQRKFLPNDLEPKTFTIRYIAGSNAGPISLSWDLGNLTEIAEFKIKDRFSGELFNEDMADFEGFMVPSEENSVLQDGLVIEVTLLDLPVADPPSFEPEPGTYFEEVLVNLSSEIETGDIFYTMDESDPVVNGILFEEPILITKNSTIRAFVAADGFLPSLTVDGIYTILPIIPESFNLLEPDSGFEIEVSSSTVGDLVFSWEESENATSYQWVLYNSSSSPDSPLVESLSDVDGTSTTFSLSLVDFYSQLEEQNLFIDNSADLIWQVKAIRRDESILSDSAFQIRFIKADDTSLDPIELPFKTELFQNYPNPFNPTTTISYSLAEPGRVSLKIFTVSGQLVSVLQEGFKSAGRHTLFFDASAYSSGTYIYQLKSSEVTLTRKMILIK